MGRRYFRIQAKILDDFGNPIFKMNMEPLDKGMEKLMSFINTKLK